MSQDILDRDVLKPQPGKNLGTFRTLFIVYGILVLLGALFFIGYAIFMSYLINETSMSQGDADVGIQVVVGMMSVLALFTVGLAIALFMASKYIVEQRKYTFIFVVSIACCFTGLLGILLGVFTLIEINKSDVKALFEANSL